jgi:hypothetical protein
LDGIHSTDWPKSLVGTSNRPGRADTSVGSDPSTTMTDATTTTSWRQPKLAARRSSSKAAMPRPIEPAVATAAGPRRTRGSMARLPVHPWPTTQALTHSTRAIDQKRTAHRKRSPRASTNGTSAATANPQARGESPMGPAAKRRSDPHEAASEAGTGIPKTDTAPVPAQSTPISQGRQRTAVTRVDPPARSSAPRVERQSAAMEDESTRANATSTTTMAAAGTNETSTASISPSASTSRRDGLRVPPSRTGRYGAAPVARNRRVRTQGAPA